MPYEKYYIARTDCPDKTEVIDSYSHEDAVNRYHKQVESASNLFLTKDAYAVRKEGETEWKYFIAQSELDIRYKAESVTPFKFYLESPGVKYKLLDNIEEFLLKLSNVKT